MIKKQNKNVTIRKRKLLPLTSKNRLKDLPSIYTKIPIDKLKKVEAAKDVFSNTIKQIPPESYKKIKIDYDQSNNIDISESRYESDDDVFNLMIKTIEFKIYSKIYKKIQKVCFILLEI